MQGVTCSVGGSGEVRLSGTKSGGAEAFWASARDLPAGTYTLSCDGLADGISCRVRLNEPGATKFQEAPSTFTVPEGTRYEPYLRVAGGTTVDATLWPMLCEGEEARPYVPYERGGAPRNLIRGFSDLSGFSTLGRGWEQLGDGWGRVTLDNSGGTSAASTSFLSEPLDEVPDTATALLEVRSATDASVTAAAGEGDAETSQLAATGPASTSAPGELRVPLSRTGAEGATCALRSLVGAAAGKDGTAEVRISLYEGDYQGPYVPWGGSLGRTSSRRSPTGLAPA